MKTAFLSSRRVKSHMLQYICIHKQTELRQIKNDYLCLKKPHPPEEPSKGQPLPQTLLHPP